MGVGAAIRNLRKGRKLTLRELAKMVNCTSGHISQIENELADPSIAALKKISMALEVKLVDFFIEDSVEDDIVLKKDQHIQIKYRQGDASVFLLVKNLHGKNIEPIFAQFWPGGGSRGVFPRYPSGGAKCRYSPQIC